MESMIENKIYYIRGKKVMLDRDLALLYGVETKALNRAVRRNISRFPDDFMFTLTEQEISDMRYQFGTAYEEHGLNKGESLRCQIGTLNEDDEKKKDNLKSQIMTASSKSSKNRGVSLRSQIATLKRGKHIKYLPYAFTEQGVAMLSSVLRSERAILVNIQIMRTFTKLRELLASNKELLEKVEQMESKYDSQFQIVFEAIKQLLDPPEEPKPRIGFRVPD